MFRNADDHVERTSGAPLVTEFGATDDLAPAAEAESGRDASVLSLKAARGVDEVGVRVAPRR